MNESFFPRRATDSESFARRRRGNSLAVPGLDRLGSNSGRLPFIEIISSATNLRQCTLLSQQTAMLHRLRVPHGLRLRLLMFLLYPLDLLCWYVFTFIPSLL